MRRWLKRNQERIDKGKERRIANGDEAQEAFVNDIQQGDWLYLSQRLNMRYEMQIEKGKPDSWLVGMTQAIVNEEEWPPVKEDIPDDHWVYLQAKKWLMEQSDLSGPAIILNSGKGNQINDQQRQSTNTEIQIKPEIQSTQNPSPPKMVPIHAVAVRERNNHHPETIDPTKFCHDEHWPATLGQDLDNGNYACVNEIPTKQINIDWAQQNRSTYATAHPWLYQATQAIMEGRSTAMEEYELDSWAMQIDKDLGQIYEDEDGDQHMTDRQMRRVSNLVATAVQWFRHQPMVRRLQRLITKGWLAGQIRLYLRHRATWPRQMGPKPANETEQRLIAIWEDSIKKGAPKVPSALDYYTAWWNLHDAKYVSTQHQMVGQKVLKDGRRLWHFLQGIQPTSLLADQLREFLQNDGRWPRCMNTHMPTSQLEIDVIFDWYGEKRTFFPDEWTPNLTQFHKREAQVLWNSLTGHNTEIHTIVPLGGRRNQQRQRQRQKKRKANANPSTYWATIPTGNAAIPTEGW